MPDHRPRPPWADPRRPGRNGSLHFTAEQRWIITPLSDGYSYIVNTAGGSVLCLTSGDGSTVEPRALAITVQPCAEIPAQIWQILPQENGYYRLGAMTFSNVMCLEGAAPDTDPLDGAAFMTGESGGAVFASTSSTGTTENALSIANSIFANNKAISLEGAAVYLHGKTTAWITAATITDNSSNNGSVIEN